MRRSESRQQQSSCGSRTKPAPPSCMTWRCTCPRYVARQAASSSWSVMSRDHHATGVARWRAAARASTGTPDAPIGFLCVTGVFSGTTDCRLASYCNTGIGNTMVLVPLVHVYVLWPFNSRIWSYGIWHTHTHEESMDTIWYSMPTRIRIRAVRTMVRT